jgi:hypothetical protein
MSDYESITGKRVKFLTSDPTLSSSYEGQVWYNSTTGVNKAVVSAGTWSSTSPAVNGASSPIGFGIQTAAVMAGGATDPGNQSYVEEYNGSGFSSGGALPTTRQDGGGAGTETAGVVWCGEGPAKLNTTAEYNGSSWTVTNTYPIAARGVRGSGTQTAAIGVGGDTPAPAASNVSAEYNGSTWTAGNTLPSNRVAAATSGPQTSALATTGKDNTPNPSVSNLNTSYDGTNWTAETVYPLQLRQAASTGTSSSANLVAGGMGATPFGDAVTTAAQWDGSSWTTTGSLGTKSTHMGYAGTSTAAIIRGGAQDYPSYPGVAQEFNQSINAITAAAFASSPTLSYSVDANLATSGSLTSAVVAGGYNAPAGPGTVSYIANAATWNGTAWSNITDMPERRTSNNAVGATAPAFYTFGGQNQPGPSTSTHLPSTYSWNGSSWSSGPALAEGQAGGAGAGTPSAIVLMGGTNPPGSISNNIQQYNGSSWSNSPVNMPTNMSSNGGVGTQTAAISFGGYQGASPFPSSGVTNTYEWDGSSISNGGSMVFGLLGCSGSGTSTAALSYGGRNTAGNKNAIGMIYNGTSWATQPSLATARDYVAMGPMGSATNCLAVAGSGGAQSLVEEFTGETSAITASTLTTS